MRVVQKPLLLDHCGAHRVQFFPGVVLLATASHGIFADHCGGRSQGIDGGCHWIGDERKGYYLLLQNLFSISCALVVGWHQ